MGKVFSWEEIVKNEVPLLHSFSEVVSLCKELSQCPGIIGGIICGSVLRGDYDLRSDLDCLILYRSEQAKKILLLLQEIVSLATKKIFLLSLFLLMTRWLKVSSCT